MSIIEDLMHVFSSVRTEISFEFSLPFFHFIRTTIFIADAVVYYGNADVAALAFL